MTFDDYLFRWQLVPDGNPIVTSTSRLLPVLREHEPAMLKIASEPEERWGAGLMTWWNGEGAARVLAHEGDALLMERATGDGSLAEMVASGQDEQATRIICGVAARLHAPSVRPRPELVSLTRWFEQLEPAAQRHGGLLRRASAVARELLSAPREVTVLHGDLHHGNILDFGPRGWLAIDPKRLVGERAFDFVNILRNPDAEVALSAGRFRRQLDVLEAAAHLDRQRLLKWTLAFCGLSAAWLLAEGRRPELDLAVAELAIAELADTESTNAEPANDEPANDESAGGESTDAESTGTESTNAELAGGGESVVDDPAVGDPTDEESAHEESTNEGSTKGEREGDDR